MSSVKVSVETVGAVIDGNPIGTTLEINERSAKALEAIGYVRIFLVTQELFPVNRVVFVSEGVGKFYYGPTLENNMAPGIVLLAEDLRQPIRSIVESHAAGFPVIEQPSLLLHADVFTV